MDEAKLESELTGVIIQILQHQNSKNFTLEILLHMVQFVTSICPIQAAMVLILLKYIYSSSLSAFSQLKFQKQSCPKLVFVSFSSIILHTNQLLEELFKKYYFIFKPFIISYQLLFEAMKRKKNPKFSFWTPERPTSLFLTPKIF